MVIGRCVIYYMVWIKNESLYLGIYSSCHITHPYNREWIGEVILMVISKFTLNYMGLTTLENGLRVLLCGMDQN